MLRIAGYKLQQLRSAWTFGAWLSSYLPGWGARVSALSACDPQVVAKGNSMP